MSEIEYQKEIIDTVRVLLDFGRMVANMREAQKNADQFETSDSFRQVAKEYENMVDEVLKKIQ